MKHIKKFEGFNFSYIVGDYIIPIETPNGKNPKDSYTVIDDVRGNSNFGNYMVSTYNIYTGKKLEGPWPIMENEILRKLTAAEINDIEIKRTAKKYNL